MLTLQDREKISRRIAENVTGKEIAARIGKCESIVSREIGRHGGRERYRGGGGGSGGRQGEAAAQVPQAGRRSDPAADRA
jgi:IS30 family transposase